jgi:hypothetical protein
MKIAIDSDQLSNLIHFGDPNLKNYNLEYTFNNTWSICGKYTYTHLNESISSNHKNVDCQDCLRIMRCDHDWKFLYRSQAGSSWKGSYYRCLICDSRPLAQKIWSPDTSHLFVENALLSKTEEEKMDIIFTGFQVYRWLV